MDPRARRLLFPWAALAAAFASMRPGISVPAATPLAGAPPLDAAWSAGRAGPLRKSLCSSSTEGMVAEVITAFTGGAVITGWALYLGASPLIVGLVTCLPQLMQWVHFPAAWVTSRFGHRPTAIVSVTLSRFALVPLSALPFLPLTDGTKQTLLLITCALSSGLSVLGNNGWVAWMGELVPGRIRGRFFGKRTAFCTLAGTLATLLAGALLDFTRHHDLVGQALAGLGLAAGLLGAVTCALMLRQHDPRPEEERAPVPTPFSMRQMLEPLRDPSARPMLRYQLTWNLACGIAGPYFALYMLQHLGMGYMAMALYGAGVALSRIVAVPLWGRTIDRRGSRPVLLFCSFGIAALPLLWLFIWPQTMWLIGVDALLAGILWGGHQVSVFSLPLSIAPRRNRPYYLAAFSSSAGVAFAVATTLGGILVAHLPAEVTVAGLAMVPLQWLFLISGVARVGAAFLGLSIHEPGSHAISTVFPIRHIQRATRILTPVPARLRRGA